VVAERNEIAFSQTPGLTDLEALRAALTERAISRPVFDVMALSGRDETVSRHADGAASEGHP
jgi:hypothetical protein